MAKKKGSVKKVQLQPSQMSKAQREVMLKQRFGGAYQPPKKNKGALTKKEVKGDENEL